MKDFKSYQGDPPQNGGQNSGNSAEVNNTVELAKILTKAMSGKTEAQMWQTILVEAERGKREGTLSNDDLDNFYAVLSPMVDGFKKKKLKEVIQKLKNM